MTRTRKIEPEENPPEQTPPEPEVKETAKPVRPLTLEDRIRAKIAMLDEKETKTQQDFDTYRQNVNAQMGFFQGALAGIKEQRDALRELLIPESSDPDTSGDGPTEKSEESPVSPASESPQATAVSSA